MMRTELENNISVNPEDEDAWSVYSDWLQGQNDPRGELVGLELALKQNPRDSSLLSRRDYLFQSLNKSLLLEFSWSALRLHWKFGYLQKAEINLYEDDKRYISRLGRLTEQLMNHEAGRFLSSLTINCSPIELSKPSDFQGIIDTLRDSLHGQHLRKLELGFHQEVKVDFLYNKFPNLESLIIKGEGFTPGRMLHRKLQLLDLRITKNENQLCLDSLDSVACGNLSALHTLILDCGSMFHGSPDNIEAFRPFFENPHLPGLNRIVLRHCVFTDDFIQELSSSPLLERLNYLRIHGSGLSNTGAEYLLQNRDLFLHLERLKLNQNELSEDIKIKIRQRFPNLIL